VLEEEEEEEDKTKKTYWEPDESIPHPAIVCLIDSF
jgi:hypothetical protein